MKKILSVVVLLLSFTFSVSAENFYVFFRKDFPLQSKTEFFRNQCISCTPKVRIHSVDTFNVKRQDRRRNENGKVEPGAAFDVTEFNKDITQIHFLDAANTDRSNVGQVGVMFTIEIVINGNTYFYDDNCMEILPSSDIKQVDQSDIISLGKYDKENNAILFSSRYFREIKGFQLSNGKVISPRIDISDNYLNLKQDCDVLHIVLSSENDYYEDFEIPINDFPILPPPPSWWEQHKKQVYCWSFIAFCVIIIIIIIILLLKWKNKHTEGKHNDASQKENKSENKQINNQVKENSDSCSLSDLLTEVNGFKKSVNSYYDEIKSETDTIKEVLNNVKLLVSNTDDKRKILQLTESKEQLEIDKQKLADRIVVKDNEIDSLNLVVKQKEDNITALESKIEEIQKANTIVGADSICGYEHFLSFSKHILDSCTKAEQLCYHYRNSLSAENQSKLEGYFCEFLFSKPTIQIVEWNSIISTLDLNGYIKAPQFSLYIRSKTNKEKVEFLNKLFFENVLRPYVSSILVLLEQLRTSDSFGLANPNKSKFEGIINEILTLCKGEDISVEFHSLLEPIKSYEMVEITDNLVPLSIEKNIDKDVHDVLLFVQQYGVNSKVSESKVKTICYINI